MTSRHAAQMDAAAYWRQFPITVKFVEPYEYVGKLIELGEVRQRDEILPKLRLQQKDGTILVIIVGQVLLLAELARTQPAVGDMVKITYHGEAKRAAPGMNPTKEFTVDVRRAGTQPPGRPSGEALGEVAGENGPEAGK